MIKPSGTLGNARCEQGLKHCMQHFYLKYKNLKVFFRYYLIIIHITYKTQMCGLKGVKKMEYIRVVETSGTINTTAKKSAFLSTVNFISLTLTSQKSNESK